MSIGSLSLAMKDLVTSMVGLGIESLVSETDSMMSFGKSYRGRISGVDHPRSKNVVGKPTIKPQASGLRGRLALLRMNYDCSRILDLVHLSRVECVQETQNLPGAT